MEPLRLAALIGAIGLWLTPIPGEAAIDFQSRILAVLEKKCFECHRAPSGDLKEPKGGLRLDAAKGILKGGESGPVLKPGAPDESPMYARTVLPDNDDDHMPKEGDSLSKLEQAFLKRWIEEGADFGGWVGNEEGLDGAPPAPMVATTTDAPTPAPAPDAPTTPDAPATPASTPSDPSAAPSPPTGVTGAVARTVHFERQVLPILRESCFECHRAPHEEGGQLKKPKASLRLDAARGIMIGSGDGPVIKAGEPDESPLYFLTTLPPDDDDIMPSEGTPLSKAQQEVLRVWILEGANFDGWIGNEEGLVERTVQPTNAGPTAADLLAAQVKGASAEALHAVGATGATITQVAVGNPLLRVEYVTGESRITDAEIGTMAPLASNITELDLSETGVTDVGLAMLSGFDKLTHLDLHNTGVTDQAIQKLEGLNYLEYLNLYGTKVTDESLPAIAKHRKLKAVYLWKTGVSKEGADKLQKALPDAKVSF